MKATQQLHDLGQSLWLDNITRELLVKLPRLVLLVDSGIRDRAAGVVQHDATHCQKYSLSKM